MHTVNVCNGVPWNASIRWITLPFVEMRMVLPSGLNFNPDQSHPLSWGSLKELNGPYKIVKHILFSQKVTIVQWWKICLNEINRT